MYVAIYHAHIQHCTRKYYSFIYLVNYTSIQASIETLKSIYKIYQKDVSIVTASG